MNAHTTEYVLSLTFGTGGFAYVYAMALFLAQRISDKEVTRYAITLPAVGK